ncbi:MAG: vitamin K epoxide reductase family protein [Candidatus Magasanikbacteria bacterium]|nr:vitamin K epoxide reductase family protein [Candidatus Magasanikbacteria bacterium]
MLRRQLLGIIFLLVSFLGFLDASYLAVEHYRGVVPPCSVIVGCELVTTSKYALIFKIPVALLGAIYYLAVLILSVAYLESQNKKWLTAAAILTPLGFLASAWFVYLQLYVIKAVCIYCVGSALTSTILFILGVVELRTKDTWWEKLKHGMGGLFRH